MTINPYEPPQPVDRANKSIGPLFWFVIKAIGAAIFGAIIVGIITAPAGAIDGGSEWYFASGAALGLAVFIGRWLLARRKPN